MMPICLAWLQFTSHSIKYLGLIACLIVTSAQAFDAIPLMESLRNNRLSEVAAQLAAAGADGQSYLRKHAAIFLPAVTKHGNVAALNLFIETLGNSVSNQILNHALVAAFNNPKFGPLIKPLLDLGASASARALGKTALGRAAFVHAIRNEGPGLDAAKLLLERGAKVDVAEDSGMTPLMWACSSDDTPLIKLLLKAGANPQAQTPEGRTAAKLGGPDCKAPLPSNGIIAKPAVTIATQDTILTQSLYQAVATGDLAQCQELLAQGVSANVTVNAIGQNLLMQTRDARVMQILLQGGANPNWIDANGWTILQRLVTLPHTAALINILLDFGIEIHRRIQNGQDALLLTHLLFVDKLDAESGTTILRSLFKAGANINSSDRDGETLLHLAAYNNAADLAQIALELGADPQLPNQRGETPLHLAKRLKAQDVLKVLRLSTQATSFKPIEVSK